MTRALASLALLALWAGPASAALIPASVSTATFAAPPSYSAVSGPIERIRIHRLNVFDPNVPGEDWWIFRVANVIHIPTKEYVLRREVLFEPGDPWNPRRAIESERNLRATNFIRSANIDPTQTPAGVDLDLFSQDAWTLAPQFNVGTEGGQSYLDYGIEESNLLGYGKQISFHHYVASANSSNGHDLRNELRYNDPRLLGSRVMMNDLFSSTPYGDEIGTLVERPFFSTDTPYYWRVLWARIIQQDVLYQDANQVTDFNQDFRTVDSSVGMKVGHDDDLIHRVFAGTHYEKDSFHDLSDTVAGTVPSDREMSGPVAGYELIQPRYIKETYIDRMQRVEDFNLGNQFSLRGGPMLQSWGSDTDRWVLSALDQQGLKLGDGRFALGQVGVQGRLHSGQLENSILYGNLNLFWKNTWPWPQTLVAHAEANTTRRLDTEHQLVLGGNTGLRGYKNYSFTGTRSALLNFEDRLFLLHEFFHLVRAGGVVFYDMGAISPPGGGFNWNWVKSDVGFGLRFSPTRSTTGGVLRMDLAYALNGGPGPSRWVVSVKGGQAFSIFNSTNRDVLSSPASKLTSDRSQADIQDDLRDR